jgi:hypothetical protein
LATKNEKPSDAVKTGRKRSGRHTRAMRRMLKGRYDIDAVTRSTLLGLVTAWDLIEETGKGIQSIPAISKELREIWSKLAPVDTFEDLWKS